VVDVDVDFIAGHAAITARDNDHPVERPQNPCPRNGRPIVSLLASPAVAIIVHRMQRLEPSAFHAQLLAKQVEEAWVASTGQPLRFVDGITNLANVVTAYAKDRSRALAGMQINPNKVIRDGKAVVCYADTECAREALTAALQKPENRLINTTITRNYLGWRGTPQGYVILIIPPKPPIK
jgi:hypothetical protein